MPEVRVCRVKPKVASKALADLLVEIDSLLPLEGNPRVGNVDAIAESLARFGQVKPIHARASDRQILAGNHTWQAAKSLGWTHIAATFDDVDDETAMAFALADNRTGDLGVYDEAALLAMLASIDDLVGTGYEQPDIERLLQRQDDADPVGPALDSTHEIHPDDWSFGHKCPECGFQWG